MVRIAYALLRDPEVWVVRKSRFVSCSSVHKLYIVEIPVSAICGDQFLMGA